VNLSIESIGATMIGSEGHGTNANANSRVSCLMIEGENYSPRIGSGMHGRSIERARRRGVLPSEQDMAIAPGGL
jgi:hypothetical protein